VHLEVAGLGMGEGESTPAGSSEGLRKGRKNQEVVGKKAGVCLYKKVGADSRAVFLGQ